MSGKGDKWRETNWKKFFNSEYWTSPKVENIPSEFIKEVKKLKGGKIKITYK